MNNNACAQVASLFLLSVFEWTTIKFGSEKANVIFKQTKMLLNNNIFIFKLVIV